MDMKMKLDELQGKVDAVSAGIAEIKGGVDAVLAESYQRGYNDGVASVVNPSDPTRIYTQVDLDTAVAAYVEQVGVLNGQNAALSAEVQAVKDGIPAQVAAAVEAAVESLKATLKEAYANAQASESAIEGSIASLLEPKVVAEQPVVEEPAPEAQV